MKAKAPINVDPGTIAQLERLDSLLKDTLPMGRIEAQSLPGCPQITLGLINADFPEGPLPADVMRDVIARPAYWALCWGSGLALARYLIAHPHWVRGRRVVDVGCGSGVVAVAAALSGAAEVIACDTDAAARAATAVNAALNGVVVQVVQALEDVPAGQDLLVMADVLYDRSNLPLLAAAGGHAREVLVAESRLATLPSPDYRLLCELPALTFPNLGEFDEFATSRLFHRCPTGDG